MSVWANLKHRIKWWVIRTAEKPLNHVLERELKTCSTVLDVGCGVNSPLGKISKTFYLEGIDILPQEKVLGIYDNYKKGDITKLSKYYKKKSFDGVVALDLIEHLTKSDGLRFLKNLDWIARKKIIILTPSGFMYQGEVGGNPFQKHLSGWTKSDFKKRGFGVYGMHGLKILRGELAGIKYKPWYVWLFISHVTQFFTVYSPKLAFHIIAIKSLDHKNKSQ